MAKRSRKTRKAMISANAPRAQQQVSAPQEMAVSAPAQTGNGVDFTGDYYYVYANMRTMLILTIAMVALMFGLAYII